MQKFKIFNHWWNWLLAIEFIIACGVVVYVVEDMIAHAQPIGHYTVTDYYREPPTETWCVRGKESWKCDMRGKITNSNGQIIWCTDIGKENWKPIKGKCYDK